ncbi:MAG: alpha/beta hydrolase [Ferruginibacter sp.]
MKKIALLASIIFIYSIKMAALPAGNKYPFEVIITGQGDQPILFIPGFGCSGEVWNDTKKLYENKYKCYGLTMPGFAGVPPTANPSFQQWVNEIAAYIKHLKINKPVLVGHSMGGAMAMAIAAQYPELVSKVVVVDALPCLAALMDPSFKSNENIDCSAMIAQMTAASDEQFYQMQKQSIKQLVADTSKQAAIINWTTRSDKNTFGKMFCDFSNTDLRNSINSIQCPVLILLEPYFAGIQGAINDQYKNLKTATILYATKGLHFIMFDDKTWYEEQLNNFVNKQGK